jgi:replicative DNA helicase
MHQTTNEKFQSSDLKRAVENVVHDYQCVLTKKPMITGLSTGFSQLDDQLDGLRTGLHLLAGRTQMGKTTMMLHIADNICFEQNVPSLIFTMEWRVEEIVRRMLLSKSLLDPFYRDRCPNDISEINLRTLSDRANQISSSQLFIEENVSFGIADLVSTARYHKNVNDIGFIAIDHLQLLRSNPHLAPSSPRTEVIDVISKLKSLAREMNIPILLITKITRKSSSKKDLVKGLPLAAHINYHDTIDGYLDTITTIYQPKYYCEDLEQFKSSQFLARLTICKSPRTSFDQLDLHFDKKMMRFFEFDHSRNDDADSDTSSHGKNQSTGTNSPELESP